MALLDDAFKGWSGLLIGLGASYVVPAVWPAVRPVLRPMVKGAVTATLSLVETAREYASEAGEQLSDVVAEARAERRGGTAERAISGDSGPARTTRTVRRRKTTRSQS
jgi:hypothetical protein